MQGPRSGEITRALARAREGRGGETRRRSTVARRDARRLTVFAPAKEVHTLMPYRELRVVPLKLTSPTTARNDERRRRRDDVRITRRDISKESCCCRRFQEDAARACVTTVSASGAPETGSGATLASGR
jgi:hypothetical protein